MVCTRVRADGGKGACVKKYNIGDGFQLSTARILKKERDENGVEWTYWDDNKRTRLLTEDEMRAGLFEEDVKE